MSRYFSFLRKKRSPSLTDDAGEDIGSSLSSSGKLRKLKGKKHPPQHVDDGFCDQRFSLQNFDFYDAESDDAKVSSEITSTHSDNDSLLDNLSYGEVCSSEGDKSLQWEKVETLTDDSRPSSSSDCPRLNSNSDSITLCDNKLNNNTQDEDEGLAHERADDYFSFDHKDLVEQVSLPDLTEVDVGSHLIDDFMDEAFNDLESFDEEIQDLENKLTSDNSVSDGRAATENVDESVEIEETSTLVAYDDALKCAVALETGKVFTQECISAESKLDTGEKVNSTSADDLTEDYLKGTATVDNMCEVITEGDEHLLHNRIEIIEVDLEMSNDVKETTKESILEIQSCNCSSICYSGNDNDYSSQSINNGVAIILSDGNIAANDICYNNIDRKLPDDQKEGIFQALEDISKNNLADEKILVEISVFIEADVNDSGREVDDAVNEHYGDVKENLNDLLSQEDEIKVHLQECLEVAESIIDESSEKVIYNNDYYEPNVEADKNEIVGILNTDFHAEDVLEPTIENSMVTIEEKEDNVTDESLLIERMDTDQVTDEDKAYTLTLYAGSGIVAEETNSSAGKETVFLTTEAEILEIFEENVIESVVEKCYLDDDSLDDAILAPGSLEINLLTVELDDICIRNLESETSSEKIATSNESQKASDIINDNDITKSPLLIENNNSDVLGNSDKATISVSTGTYSELDEEFDSAQEDLSDVEADVNFIVKKSPVDDKPKVDRSKDLSDTLKSEVFGTAMKTDPTPVILSDEGIDKNEVVANENDDFIARKCVKEVGVEMQDAPDNSLCIVASSCYDSCDSLKDSKKNSSQVEEIIVDTDGCYSVNSKNICDDHMEKDSVRADNCSGINTSEITDELVTNFVQSYSEIDIAKVQSITSPLDCCDNDEIVITRDEVPVPIISSQISLIDSIAKEYDVSEESLSSNCTISKDDCDLLDEESFSPDDLSSSLCNERKMLQNTNDNRVASHDIAVSDKELKSTHQSSNDNSKASNASKKYSSNSCDENFLFDHSDHVEAEARLAQRRAARAEARELRLRELEKQQQDHDDEDEQQYAANSFAPADKKLQNAAPPPRTNTPYISKSSPRGVSSARASVGRSSSLANSTGSGGGGQYSRRSSKDSTPDDALPLSSRELKAELMELEEKFRKAMITNAQLDNEKATLTYEVEFLKDKYSDMDEMHHQLAKEHKKKCSENETLRKLTNKLKEEVKMVRKVLQERDSLIQEYGLVLIGEENGEDNFDNQGHDDAEMEDETINDLSPRKIGIKKALLSMEASELLSKGAAQGSLDVRLKKYAERKNDLEDEVRRLKLELEEELSKRRKENGLDYEKQKEASKSINEYKFRVQKAEAEVSTLQANVARLESLVTRYKASTEELEKSEEDLKSEKRKLQRELREAQNRLEELELTTSHLQKRFDKLKTARSTLLKDLSQDPV